LVAGLVGSASLTCNNNGAHGFTISDCRFAGSEGLVAASRRNRARPISLGSLGVNAVCSAFGYLLTTSFGGSGGLLRVLVIQFSPAA
jgi:hypothetical protein